MRLQTADFRFRDRVSSIAAWVLTALVLLAAFAGCGGGGGSRIIAPPPINDQLFTPNYIASLTGEPHGVCHWDHLPIRVGFTLPGDWQQIYPTDQDLHIRGANEWNQSGRQVMVVVTSGQIDVPVSFVSQKELGGSAQGMTGYTYDATGRMLSASIRIAHRTSKGVLIPASDVQSFIAHEIGHALGIIGHSPNPGDLMYPVHTYGVTQVASNLDLNTAMSGYPIYFGRAIPLDRGIAPMPTPEIVTGTIE